MKVIRERPPITSITIRPNSAPSAVISKKTFGFGILRILVNRNGMQTSVKVGEKSDRVSSIAEYQIVMMFNCHDVNI